MTIPHPLEREIEFNIWFREYELSESTNPSKLAILANLGPFSDFNGQWLIFPVRMQCYSHLKPSHPRTPSALGDTGQKWGFHLVFNRFRCPGSRIMHLCLRPRYTMRGLSGGFAGCSLVEKKQALTSVVQKILWKPQSSKIYNLFLNCGWCLQGGGVHFGSFLPQDGAFTAFHRQ